MKTWTRKCEECGKTGEYKHPEEYKSDAWMNVKCKYCKSMGLNYGKWKQEPEEDDGAEDD